MKLFQQQNLKFIHFLLLPAVAFANDSSTGACLSNNNNNNITIGSDVTTERAQTTAESINVFDSTAKIEQSRNVQTKIPGVFWRDSKTKYVMDIDWVFTGKSILQRVKDSIKFFLSGGFFLFVESSYALYGRSVPATIYDARAKEKEEGLSKKEFFDKYGFVLLSHKTAMDADGWSESDRDIGKLLSSFNSNDGEYEKIMDDFRNGDTAVKSIYANEVVDLIRSIVPDVKTVMPPARGIRRYITNNLNKAPAKQVHNDYGLNFDEVVDRNPFFDFQSQRKKFEETDSDEYMLVNLWRPIRPMSDEPLRSFPLCFLDSSTISSDDFVSIDYNSFGVVTGLKQNPEQHKFYYYPDMTVDEVVIFKQFHKARNETLARMPTFHTAFADPTADENTEGRVSFEYRVGLLI